MMDNAVLQALIEANEISKSDLEARDPNLTDLILEIEGEHEYRLCLLELFGGE